MALYSIMMGIVSAVLYAIIGYGSGKIKDGEMKFDKYKLLQTIISGVIAGVILFVMGVPVSYGSVNEVLAMLSGNVFFIFLLNKFTSVVYKLLR